MLKHMLQSPASTPGSTANGVNGIHTHNHHHPHRQAHQDGIVMLTDLPPHARPIRPHPNLSLNLSQRHPNHHALNVSTLSTSKHSLGNSSSVSPCGGVNPSSLTVIGNGPVPQVVTPSPAPPKLANGGLNIPRERTTSVSAGSAILLPANVTKFIDRSKEAGVKGMLTSLGLLCLVSLLLALLSLIFLLKIASPATLMKEPLGSDHLLLHAAEEQLTVISAEEYEVVYEITLALCSLTLSLNLCCLLVCAIQFLFAVKLVRSSLGAERTNKYLQKSSVTRVCAVSGFFISIPIFLTGIILYTFIQFHSTPAIITSAFIGMGIIFCGCAMVHNVFVWQKEKTNAVRARAQQQQHHHHHQTHHHHPHIQALRQPTPPTPVDHSKTPSSNHHDASGSGSPGMPVATIDLSSVGTTNSPHELSTLV